MIARRAQRRGPARQGGLGALTILLAMLVVVVLAGAALKQYGVGGAARPAPRELAGENADAKAPAVAPAPRNVLESAKAVESTMQQQADEIAKKIDDQGK